MWELWQWIPCRIIHDVLLSHFIEWFWGKTNPQMMQGNLGGSFYRELSWLGQPHLYSAAGFQPCASFGRCCCWRGRGGFTGRCQRWGVTVMGWCAVRWYYLWLVYLMLFLHGVLLMAMMMMTMLQLFGPWRILTIFCHSLTVFENQLQDFRRC